MGRTPVDALERGGDLRRRRVHRRGEPVRAARVHRALAGGTEGVGGAESGARGDDLAEPHVVAADRQRHQGRVRGQGVELRRNGISSYTFSRAAARSSSTAYLEMP